jgi:peptide/nickel transport system substrate-binding protein
MIDTIPNLVATKTTSGGLHSTHRGRHCRCACRRQCSGRNESLLRAAFSSQRDVLSVFHCVGRVNADTNRRIFSSLTQFDADLNLIGDLAESWSLSDDRLTYTFNLRQGVMWHDGAPFTS